MPLAEFVDQGRFPAVAKFLDSQVEMQIADLRVMMGMPRRNGEPGFNLSSLNVMLDLVAGFSVCLFEASEAALTNRQDRGSRFKRLLTDYYPWEADEWGAEGRSEWLWNVARSPLAHALGVLDPSIAPWFVAAKRPLSAMEIGSLESDPAHPAWLPGTLVLNVQENAAAAVVLSVPTLYWGTWRMVEALCQDEHQMDLAEVFLGHVSYGT